MKKLGFGLMRLPVKDGVIDHEEFCRMADKFIDDGFTYFDTAYMYHNGASECAFREAVVRRHPRDSFTIADKLPLWSVNEPADMEKIFNTQLERCGVEYFDYYLLHSMGKGNHEKANAMGAYDFLKKKKSAGLAGHIGFSFHDKADVLEDILKDHPEMEFVQLQLNYLDWESDDVQSRKCYETARKYGLDVIAMEPVKGGALAGTPKEAELMLRKREPEMSVASWAVRFCASLDGMMTVLSGMSNMDQLTDNVSYMKNFVPLTEEDRDCLMKTLEIRNNPEVPCTSCGYCTEGCPSKIAIPKYLALYNGGFAKGMTNIGWEISEYAKLKGEGGAASDCIGCRACESVCPQKINISDFLKSAAMAFEKA